MHIKLGKRKIVFSRFRLFVLGVTLVKIVLMVLFSSDYSDKMFAPFVNQFVSGITNPYDYYHANNLPLSFPYPPVMLIVESIGMFLVKIAHFIGMNVVLLDRLLFKIPLLFFDFLCFAVLFKLYPNKKKITAILYVASPIIIYSTYMHGQLDIIPSALLMCAIYFLIKSKSRHSALYFVIFLSLALLSKTHILAICPILLIYVYNKFGLRDLFTKLAAVSLICIVAVLPFWGEGFVSQVLFNSEQDVLTQIVFPFLDTNIIVPLMFILLVYILYFATGSINHDLLLSFCGLLFSVLLIFSLAKPGWYVWVVPFVTIFLSRVDMDKSLFLGVFFGMNLAYFVYFCFLRDTGYVDLYFLSTPILKFASVGRQTIENCVFTALESFMICSALIMYKLGIESNSFYSNKNKPFVISVAGDSGSGKSVLLSRLTSLLDDANVLAIEGDGDHKFEREDEMWNIYTHLNPKANYLYRQAMDINLLKKNVAVKRVEYDHDTGKFTEIFRIKPKRFVVVCGLHSAYLPQMRKLSDLKIFMDTDTALKIHWKIMRDISKRGYSMEKIVEQISTRQADVDKYINPQKEYADLTIRYYNTNADETNPKISINLKLKTEINADPLLSELEKLDIKANHEFTANFMYQIIDIAIEDEGATIDFSNACENLVQNIDEIVRNIPGREKIVAGITKVVMLYMISWKLNEGVIAN